MSAATRTLIVGVLNVTPDSFSDGGRFRDADEAAVAGMRMVEAGADWIDVGGESTRPGATPVPADEERARVVPVIERLVRRLEGRARVSIDTYKASTARAALGAGAAIVNDVTGGRMDPLILDVAAGAHATIVLGHLRGTPATMMRDPRFVEVVGEVGDELAARVAVARAAGCQAIWVDPGLGFGKLPAHNLSLLAGLPALCARVATPVMVGASRKRFVGELVGKAVDQREFGNAAAVAAAILGGASAVRVHDVEAMRDVARVADAIRSAGRPAVH